MAIDFDATDVTHKLQVKFIPAYLPDAKKAYYVKPVHQPELDIHDLASKAEVYNISTSPKVIEEGLNAGFRLIRYLIAEGFIIKTPLFTIKTRVPGEYNGSETHLAEGVYPLARIQAAAELNRYMKERIKIEFDGKEESDGFIAEAIDEATGLVDEVATIGNILTLHGYGLKIESDEEHKDLQGVFFLPPVGVPIKASVIAVNEPRTLKVVVPADLVEGTAYKIAVETMSSAKGSSSLLKKGRDMRSDFRVTAQK